MADGRSVELEITGRSEGLKKAASEARGEVDSLKRSVDEFATQAGEANTETAALEGNLGDLKKEANQTAEAVDTVGKKSEGASFRVKDLGKSIVAGLSAFAVLRENIRGIQPELEVATREFGTFADTLTDGDPALEQAKNSLVAMVNPLKILPTIFENFNIAFKKLAEDVVGNSDVLEIPADKAEEIRKKFLETRPVVEDLGKAHEDGGKKAEEAAEKSVAAAERKAAAEQKAAADTVAALEREAAARQKAISDAEAAFAKSMQAATADGGGLSTDPQLQGRADAAQKKVEELKGKVSELEALDFLTLDQMSQLDSMKTQLAGASQAATQFANDATLGTTAIIDQAEAVDLLAENQKVLDSVWADQSATHQRVLDQLAKEEERYDSISGATEEFADSAREAKVGIEGAARASEKLADSSKQVKEDNALGEIGGEKGLSAVEVMQRLATLSAELRDNLRDAAAAV